MDPRELEFARQVLLTASSVLVITGAGLSAEAGLPTYRGRNGLWSRMDPSKFTSLRAFENDPLAVWTMCSSIREQIATTGPSAAHMALARFALGRRRVSLVTQNVDGLHDRAASLVGVDDPSPARAAEIHGNIWYLRCLECGTRFEDRHSIRPDDPPRCPGCDGRSRPDIVWFGESPQRAALLRAVRAAQDCGACLVVGTSALVSPASKLPVIATSRGARVIEINPGTTPLTDRATVSLRTTAGEGLAAIL